MQLPGVTFKVSGGAVSVLVVAWLWGDATFMATQWAHASQWLPSLSLTVLFLLPLSITLVLALLTRFAVLQKLFGSMYKDLTAADIKKGKHLLDPDAKRLRQLLERWHAPMPYLARADDWLALWAGSERWTVAGFDRCWLLALVYPLICLSLTWAVSNRGSLGAQMILMPVDDARLRWWLVLTIAAVSTFSIAGGLQTRRIDLLRQKLSRLGRVGHLWSYLPNSFLYGLTYTVAVAGTIAIAGLLVQIEVLVGTVYIAGVGSVTDIRSITGVGFKDFIDVAVTFLVMGALIGVVLLVFKVIDDMLRKVLDRRGWPTLSIGCSRPIVWICVLAGAVFLLPLWTAQEELSAGGIWSAIVVFFGVLPLLNGFSDWISLNATRMFIARMQAGASRGAVARLYVLDVLVALALTIMVYGGTLALFWGMQRAGWPVDLAALLRELRDHPWDGQNNWMMMLAITNIIPTLVHLVLWVFYGVESRDAPTRELIEQFLREGGASAPRQIAPTIIYLLKLKPWLEKAMVLSLALALVPLFTVLVPWGAGLVLTWL